MADEVTPNEVLTYLSDVDYPADKDALVAAAERMGAVLARPLSTRF